MQPLLASRGLSIEASFDSIRKRKPNARRGRSALCERSPIYRPEVWIRPEHYPLLGVRHPGCALAYETVHNRQRLHPGVKRPHDGSMTVTGLSLLSMDADPLPRTTLPLLATNREFRPVSSWWVSA